MKTITFSIILAIVFCCCSFETVEESKELSNSFISNRFEYVDFFTFEKGKTCTTNDENYVEVEEKGDLFIVEHFLNHSLVKKDSFLLKNDFIYSKQIHQNNYRFTEFTECFHFPDTVFYISQVYEKKGNYHEITSIEIFTPDLSKSFYHLSIKKDSLISFKNRQEISDFLTKNNNSLKFVREDKVKSFQEGKIEMLRNLARNRKDLKCYNLGSLNQNWFYFCHRILEVYC